MGELPRSRASLLLVVGRVSLIRLVTFLVLIHHGVAFANGRSEPTLEFHGNSQISTDALRSYLHAETPTFLEANGDIDQMAVDRASILVSAYYLDHGYAAVRINATTIDHAKRRIDFTIQAEGDRFAIKTVAVKGTLLRTEKAFLNMLATKKGAVLSRSVIVADMLKLSRFHHDRGYASVHVVPLTNVDLPSKTISLTFEIDPGRLSFIEKIHIDGNTKTSTQAILDLLSFKEGDLFHGGKLESSKAQLIELLGLREVVMSTRTGSTDARIELVIEVQE